MDFTDVTMLTLVMFLFWYLFNFMFWDDTSKVHKLLCLVITIVWLTSDGWEQERKFVENRYIQKILVSTQPSHTQIEGSVSGNFMMFSGVIGEKRVYLLREEVSEGLYKDFEVQGETYIREDKNLTNKGKFVQEYGCYDVDITLNFYGWEALSLDTKFKCDFVKQEIVVPQGSVIKELNI